VSVALYMDVQVERAITDSLRLRGVDVLTAQADGRAEEDDSVLLERAHELQRVLFTHDQDFLTIAADYSTRGVSHFGIVYAHPLTVSIGQCVRDLEMLAQVYDPVDMANRVEYLPY
jgi:predicted nuclease of predicted toxin-antitoxin system